MTAPRLSRRRFLHGSALVGLGAVLAACDGAANPPPSGGEPISPGASPSTSGPPDPGSLTPTGPLTFANRDGYIDTDADGVTSPTIEAFEEEYGVEVHYANGEVEDGPGFVAGIRPQLERGVEPGWDLVVLPDWLVARLVANGWAEPIDPSHVPVAGRNLREELKGQPWDPDQRFHYPWVSFATGIAWHRESAGRDLGRVEDLFDPALAGRVSLLRTARETLPMVHLLLQRRSETSQRRTDEMAMDDVVTAIEFLRPFVDSGQFLPFTRANEVDGLIDGSTTAALASSRELAAHVGEAVGFAYPDEGWVGWSDNVVIPKAAKNRYTAELMIDWVYDPDRAAQIASFARGISPVVQVADALGRLENAPDPRAPGYVLLFPPTGVLDRRHRQPTWDEEMGAEVDDLFAELTGA